MTSNRDQKCQPGKFHCELPTGILYTRSAGSLMRALPLATLLTLTLLTHDLLCADDLRVADVFGDNAVLQRDVRLPVWGTTDANKTVTVRFAGQEQTVIAKPDGSWRLELAPLEESNRGATLAVESGESRKEFRDLLVGDVWYASGQSNMQMTLAACARKEPVFAKTISAAPTNKIRWLRIDEPDSSEPLKRLKMATSWQVDEASSRAKQSAVAYFFASRLHQELGVPIGIIESSWGGKPIEGFIPREQFLRRKTLRGMLSLADEDRLDELASIEGGVVVRNTAGLPGRIFNARVWPIAPYAVKGFIWYQGESNAGVGEDPRNYRIKMRALVDGWRAAWGQQELPFYFVQLPAYKDEAIGWVRLREEQRRSLDIQNTGMAVTIDLRDPDIHPANKIDVGNRLAVLALAKTYGQKIVPSGPLFRSARVEANSMRVAFWHAEAGLMVGIKRGLDAPIRSEDDKLAHFELADQSGVWHSATATIEGNEVVVHSDAIKNPRAVRYACSGAPKNANLYNEAGLPASPFCSELELLPWTSPKQ